MHGVMQGQIVKYVHGGPVWMGKGLLGSTAELEAAAICCAYFAAAGPCVILQRLLLPAPLPLPAL